MAETLTIARADPRPAAPRRYARLLPVAAVLLLLALVPPIATALGDTFLIRVFTRVIIFGIAAVALNLVLGFGGMVSLLHGGFVGIGGYVVGILAFHDFNAEPLLAGPLAIPGTSDLAVALPVALAVTAAVAALTGLVSLRTSGIYFIMITLAFNQMLYYFFVALQQYGGDDGLQILSTPTFLGMDITGRVTFYYICLGALFLVLVLMARLVDSRFGVVLRAAAQNERRVVAVGIAPLRYKLTAFVLSGVLAGLAGALLATGQQFISPVDMSWIRSGDLVVMAVLGGIGAVWGPLVGAACFLLLELVLETWTTHWQLAFGLLIVLMVTFLRGGVADLWARLVPASDRIPGGPRG